MFLAVVSGVMRSPTQVVHLMEKNVVLVECPDGVWVLDTGASNYMIGCRATLSHLDKGVCGTLCFSDGSSVEIHGLGSMVIQG
jgi:hypothetical protein